MSEREIKKMDIEISETFIRQVADVVKSMMRSNRNSAPLNVESFPHLFVEIGGTPDSFLTVFEPQELGVTSTERIYVVSKDSPEQV